MSRGEFPTGRILLNSHRRNEEGNLCEVFVTRHTSPWASHSKPKTHWLHICSRRKSDDFGPDVLTTNSPSTKQQMLNSSGRKCSTLPHSCWGQFLCFFTFKSTPEVHFTFSPVQSSECGIQLGFKAFSLLNFRSRCVLQLLQWFSRQMSGKSLTLPEVAAEARKPGRRDVVLRNTQETAERAHTKHISPEKGSFVEENF